MKTRSDYMSKAITHREYYGQFVTPEVTALVLQEITAERINRSTDPHFNDIGLPRWDRMSGDIDRLTRAAVKAAGDTMSLSTTCCIAKEAARQIKEAQAAS
jgi:hypothetical protein